jgi:hypothetical protein
MSLFKLSFSILLFTLSQTTLANPAIAFASGFGLEIAKKLGEQIAKTSDVQNILKEIDNSINKIMGHTPEDKKTLGKLEEWKDEVKKNKTPELPADQRQKIIDYIAKLQPPVDSKNSNLQINFAYRLQHKGALKPLNSETVLKSGDSYKITVNPKQDSHLYIFQIDSSNKIFALFPMKEFNGMVVNNFNPIKANVTQILPKDNLSFSLDTKTGTEKIYVFVSQAPDAELQKLADAQNIQVAQFEQVTKTRGLGSIVVDPKETLNIQGDSSSQPNSTLPVSHLEGLCNQKASGCAYVLSFKHE